MENIFDIIFPVIIIIAAIAKAAAKTGKGGSKKEKSKAFSTYAADIRAKLQRDEAEKTPARWAASGSAPISFNSSSGSLDQTSKRQLEQIERYYESGLIDKEEYRARKAKIQSGR